MPVRIYDIAKKLGIESKEVLAKAKELGIPGARVPSSSLDKITAAYLEEQLGGALPPQPESPPPAPEPVVVVTAPPEPPPPVAEPPHEEPPPPAAEPVMVDEPVVPVLVEPAATPLVEEQPPVIPGEPTAIEEIAAEPVAAPEPPVAAEPEVVVPPPPPPPPPAPRIGEKVGFIQLPQRPQPRTATPRVVPPRAPAQPVRPGRPGDRMQSPGPGRPTFRGGEREPTATKPAAKFVPPTTGEVITIKPPIIVRDLAEALRKKPFQIIADLMEAGVFATVNQAIEEPIAQRVCAKHGFRFEVEKRERGGGIVHAPRKPVEVDLEDRPEDLRPRAPVVTIMGHVDHGKTTVLDVIRKSNVAAREAGGITQHIGAYTISIPHPERKNELQQITFLDTPGHEAFSSMRARGANVTDIVILVIAANDGVMPQTIEALNHALAAKVPIMVAVNKCDHPNATPMKVRQQLQEKGLVCEEWGGSTIFVDVSALTRQGIDKLLELLVLQAEMLELKANPTRAAKGNVIESGLEPGGPTATLLIRKGTLRVGDMLLCGQYWGKVRALVNEEGNRLKEAGPSVAVKVLGLNGVPEAGLEFSVFPNEKDARTVAEERASQNRVPEKERRPRMTIENFFSAIESESAKVFKVVVKADTQGSVEAIVEAVKKIESSKVSLDVIHSGVGAVTESDVVLAAASKAVVLGFHCRIDSSANEAAKREGVQIKLYSIIYELIDQVKEAMAGLLDPDFKEVVTGSAEVRKVFTLSKGGNVAGCVVTSGRIVKGKMRVMRRKSLVYEGVSHSLRRFQDEVTEVRAGIECGIRIDGFNDYQIGDAIECYSLEKIAQSL
ncbi:MAG: translation initiation factor IF-2 [Verrucomicrobia bacterium]|nr:translation initiation factor IF-2 [Verrucomicrobiota bacterium]